MKKILLVSQFCDHCYDLLDFIRREGHIETLKSHGISIHFLNRENPNSIKYMGDALRWLAAHEDEDLYGSQESATPVLCEYEDGRVTVVYAGTEEIEDYFRG